MRTGFIKCERYYTQQVIYINMQYVISANTFCDQSVGIKGTCLTLIKNDDNFIPHVVVKEPVEYIMEDDE